MVISSRERGVALVTVLLVVAIATVLGVAMATEQNLSIQRARSFFEQGQVRQYVLGGEELARQILREDFDESLQRDYLNETWAAPGLVYEFESGTVELEIDDLQGRFNLNNLAGQAGSANLSRQRFISLLARLNIDPVYADRIADFIDNDQSNRSAGAEDYNYLGLEQPYRTADQWFQSVSELRLVFEMTDEVYSQLEPWVTVLPGDDITVNVNTAGDVVLGALGQNVSIDQIDAVLEGRDTETGIQSVQDFAVLMGTPPSGQLNLQGLGVQSSFFRIRVRAQYNERFGYLTSIVHRNELDGAMQVIYRDFSQQFLPLEVNDDQSG